MKKEKLLVKEINVLSEVIKSKIEGERKKLLDEKVGKSKEYLDLVKRVKKYNSDVEKMKKLEDGFWEDVKKIEKKFELGSMYEGKDKIGRIGYSGVIGNYSKEVRLVLEVNNMRGDDVYNRLMIENIDGDLKVNDLIERMVKEFVGK